MNTKDNFGRESYVENLFIKHLKILFFALTLTIISLSPTITFANNFNGAYENLAKSNYIKGVYASIGTAKYPVVYNYFSCAWPMVANSGNSLQYVQVGWMYKYGSNNNNSMNYFFEWNNGSPTNFTRVFSSTGPAQDSAHGYQVNLNGAFGTGTWVGTVDNAQIGSVADSQLTWSPPTEVEYFGEIVDYSEAFPGQAADHVNFSSVQYYDGGLGRWTVPNLSRVIDPDGEVQWTVGNDFTSWDNRF